MVSFKGIRFLSLSAWPVRCLGRIGAELCFINSSHLTAGGEKRGEEMVWAWTRQCAGHLSQGP